MKPKITIQELFVAACFPRCPFTRQVAEVMNQNLAKCDLKVHIAEN